MASVHFQIPGCFGGLSREGKETLIQIPDKPPDPDPHPGPGSPCLNNCFRPASWRPRRACPAAGVPTATVVIRAVTFHLELTLCSVSNFKQILFLSLHFRGEKIRPSWVFHCPQQTRVCSPRGSGPRQRKDRASGPAAGPRRRIDADSRASPPHSGLSVEIFGDS